MPVTYETVHTCVSIQNTNATEVLSDSYKYFTFGKPHVFLHIYDLLNIPHLAIISVCTAMKFLLQFINSFTLGRHIFSSTLMTTYL